MRRNVKWLTFICIFTILGLFALQGYWIRNYYRLSSSLFTREVNLAFEDALKREFSVRADTIQTLLEEKLLDTQSFSIRSKIHPDYKRMTYTIESKSQANDRFQSTFSLNNYEEPTSSEHARRFVAARLAQLLRNEDIDNHVIYYRTQTLGKFMAEVTEKLQFDTLRLRPILRKQLNDRGISMDFSFLARASDSTFHLSTFPDTLLHRYPIITRSLPTYSQLPNQQYIRVLFKNPFTYLLSNMWLLLSCAVFLSLLMGWCLYFLLSSLYREKKLVRIKNDFISNITHEFKTPLATAGLAIEALQDLENLKKLPDSEKVFRYLGHARQELEQLGSLTEKILKLSLYESEDQVLKKEKFNVGPVMKEVIAHYFINEESNVRIDLEEEGLPENLLADEEQFRHALSNVLENAVKYGTNPIEIHVSTFMEANKWWVIDIRDNGPGIPEEALPLIFDKFFRVKNQGIKGYGLGLHYVQQILHLHRGWCKVTNLSSGLSVQLAWPYE